jgi:hypothetical protein
MNETVEKHRALAEKLYALTIEKKLVWKVDDWINGYVSPIGDHIINLNSAPGEFDDNDYFVRILTNGYDEIDAFSDVDISRTEDRPVVGNFDNHYLLLQSLYRTVKRQISGADNALESILKDLSKI